MPTTQISFECTRAIIFPGSNMQFGLEIDNPDVQCLLENVSQEDIISYINKKLNPEDIFSTTQLDKWAESEGYVKSIDNE